MLNPFLVWKRPRSGAPPHRRRATYGALAAVFLMAGLVKLPDARDGPPLALAEAYRADPAVAVAAEELAEALRLSLGGTGPRLMGISLSGRTPFRVVAGLPDSPEVEAVRRGYSLALSTPGPEGYVIHPLPQATPPGALVVGGGPLGLAYGLLALGEDLRLQRPYLQYPLPVIREPAMELRLVSDPLDPRYPGPDQALKWGYNAVMTEPWPALALYDAFDPAIYDPGAQSQARAWVEERRRLARAQIGRAKALHLKVLAPGDVISLPAVAQGLYGAQVTDGALYPRYCIERPRVQALLAAALDEVFATYPELDGVVIRTGENYPLGPLAGNTPQDAQCRRTGDGQESLAATLRFLHQQVVGKHGKLLVQRAWDLGNEGLHAQAAGTARLSSVFPAAVPPVLSFKISETDFWRYNGLNPNLLQQGAPRMVEFQAAREYEGKGAFPNYVAGIYAHGPPERGEQGGLREAHRAGVSQAWVWAKGGGWGGPHPQHQLWNEANVYALSRLLWDPQADPHALAQDWATLRFGAQAAPYMARLLERSAEATLKGFYFRCYASRNSAWVPNLLWVRDDIIASGAKLEELYQACREEPDFSSALQEKQEALALARLMQEDFRQARPFIVDKALARRVDVSLEYQRTLFETLLHYTTGMFSFYRYRESQGLNQAARAAALEGFQRLQESWLLHTQVVARLPGAPTPYQDAGMGPTVEAAKKELEGR
ncbi:MAG: hypothetical protein HYY02_06235 [Chloroflexi bacterium]|nr:hypothetical protein [Chloroflexota bacterium]